MISNYGRIHSKKSDSFLSVYEKNLYGYVSIRWEDQGYHMRVNRLVAKAFLPNPKNLPEVNHHNLNKMDNHVDNLTWMTTADNAKHAREYGAKYTRIKYTITRISTGKQWGANIVTGKQIGRAHV